MLWTAGPVALVVAVVIALVVTALPSSHAGTSSKAAEPGSAPAPPSLLQAIGSIEPSALAKAGEVAGLTGPQKISPPTSSLVGPGGKTEILYVGAEWCPFCAAERWALALALSQFGHFSSLGLTHSSTVDVYPDTKTISFYRAKYVSASVDFVPVELETNQMVGGRYPTLQRLTTEQQSIVDSFDRQPYTSETGAIPFVDIGNRFVNIGASYNPGLLSGLSAAQIARQLAQPRSPVARAIDGTAKLFTSAISKATGVRPRA